MKLHGCDNRPRIHIRNCAGGANWQIGVGPGRPLSVAPSPGAALDEALDHLGSVKTGGGVVVIYGAVPPIEGRDGA